MKDLTQNYSQDDKPELSILSEVSLDIFGVEFNDLIPEHKKMVAEEFGKWQLEIINEGLAEHIKQIKQ